MRVWLLLLVVFLAVGLIAGTLMNIDTGYVLVSWHNYTLEMTLWVYLGMTMGLMLLLYVLVQNVPLSS